MRLEDQVSLITGAASGMGASMARIFAREGAKVVVADVLEEEGRRVVAGSSHPAAAFRRWSSATALPWSSSTASRPASIRSPTSC